MGLKKIIPPSRKADQSAVGTMNRPLQRDVRNIRTPIIPRHPLLDSGSLAPSGTVGDWRKNLDRGYRVSRWSKNRPIRRRAWDVRLAPAAEPPPVVNER